MRTLLALAALAALAACNPSSERTSREERESSSSDRDRDDNRSASRDEDRDRDRDRDRGDRNRDEGDGTDRDRPARDDDLGRGGDGDRADRLRDDDPDRVGSDDRASRDEDPQLARDLSAEAEIGRRSLPRRLDGGLTFEDVDADGNALVFFFRMDRRIDDSLVGAMETAERNNMCRQASTRALIARGAVFDYRITDSTGEEHRFDYSSCPSR